jgi:hypothetical protein
MNDDDRGSHGELLALLATAHEAVGQVHRYVHERRPKLDGRGIYDVPVAWRKHKSGFWAYTDHHPEKADLARHHGWEPLFVGPEDDDQPPKLRAAG